MQLETKQGQTKQLGMKCRWEPTGSRPEKHTAPNSRKQARSQEPGPHPQPRAVPRDQAKARRG